MWGVEAVDERGFPTHSGAVTVTPIARTWAVGIGGFGWSTGVAYSAPVLEVVHDGGPTEEVPIPDFGLWLRLAAVLATVAAVVFLGGRR